MRGYLIHLLPLCYRVVPEAVNQHAPYVKGKTTSALQETLQVCGASSGQCFHSLATLLGTPDSLIRFNTVNHCASAKSVVTGDGGVINEGDSQNIKTAS